MKAERKKARWLLIALLFGFLAAAGLTLFAHHGSHTVAKATIHAATPAHPKPRLPHAVLLASSGGKRALLRAGPPLHLYRAPVSLAGTHSNTRLPGATGRSNAPAMIPSGPAWSSPGVSTVAGSTNTSPAPRNPPAVPAASHLPQGLGNSFAYNGYAPLDCELPAGCGATGGTGYVSHQPSGTIGVPSSVQGAPTPQTNVDSNQQTGNSGDNGNTGNTGNSGNTGNAGNTGNTGNTGNAGNTGNTGSTGNTGNAGNTGNTGNSGNSGKGNDGTQGNSGAPGNGGNTSDPGTPGTTGKSDPPVNPVASAPELDPATLAGAVTLLLGSLVVLRRRRRAHATR
jgi:hypothetical protein